MNCTTWIKATRKPANAVVDLSSKEGIGQTEARNLVGATQLGAVSEESGYCDGQPAEHEESSEGDDK